VAPGGSDPVTPPAGRTRSSAIHRIAAAWREVVAGDVDLTTRVGSVTLPNPVMTASGTAGHGDELAAYFPLGGLGATVVKSLAAYPWPGNAAPRVHETASGMVNSVGLQGPGIDAWLADELPRLAATGGRVVVSIWGRSTEEFAEAARRLDRAVAEAGATGPARVVVAVEINVSCPNVEDRRRMFAHSPSATAAVVAAVTTACRLPAWAKLSPNVADVAEVAAAAIESGAEAVTLVNTVLAMAIDAERRRLLLGGGGGGLSGPAIHPVALRAVWDCHAALPDATIVGVGGVASGVDAVELLLAGASAVQVGTATFRDPRAPWRVLDELEHWCARHGVRAPSELRGAAHR